MSPPPPSSTTSPSYLDVLAPERGLVVAVPDDHGVLVDHVRVHVPGTEAWVVDWLMD